MKIIAEAGQTMRGDVGLAVEMVHAFAEAGATHFKVQMIDPMRLATLMAGSYWQTGPKVTQRKQFYDNGIIPHDGWDKVRAACDDARVAFVATPFDLGAVEALKYLDPSAVKIASGDITFTPLLRAVGNLGKRVFLSTGASRPEEITAAVVAIVKADPMTFSMITPLACTLAYPCPMDCAKLHRIRSIRESLQSLWSFDVGYSDHTTEAITAFAAVAAGATVLEKHVTPYPAPTRRDDHTVPDDLMGLGVKEFARYVKFAKDAERLLGNNIYAPPESESRIGARRAARFARDLPAGHVVRDDDVTYLRPDPDGDGASIRLAQSVPTTRVAVKAGDVLDDVNCDRPF